MARRLAAAALSLAPLAAAGGEALASTPLLDSTHPAIVAVAARITATAETPRERSVRVHDFVRHEIAFGVTPSFPAAGFGCCSTESTLLVALLRASEVPARRHFVVVAANQRLDTLRRAPQ